MTYAARVKTIERLIGEIERELGGFSGNDDVPWTVLLVAHGDVLQIAQTAFARADPTQHRDLPHLETAAVRELVVNRVDES